VAGLQKDVPIINSSFYNELPCEYFYISQGKLPRLNPISRKVFGRDVDRVFYARNGAVGIGQSIKEGIELVNSPEISPGSFRDDNAPLAGPAGLKEAVKNGLIRTATEADYHAWLKAVRSNHTEPDVPPVEGENEHTNPWKFLKLNSYVVLKPFTMPAGLYGAHSVNFFVAKGVPLPAGEPGHSTIYDINSGKCLGVGPGCEY